jgi:phenylacetate-CoA ligase
MEKLAGRTADFLIKIDGGLVAGVSLIERTLTAIPGIAQLPIIQEELDELWLNVVPDQKFSAASREKLVAEFRNVFGDDTQIKVTMRSRIQQEKNGKYRFSICNVDNPYQRTVHS